MKKAVLFFIFVVLGIAATGLIMAKAQSSNTIKNNKVATALTEEHTNRLVDSFSPYLRQHAHNPVDWYPWGKEALEKAKAENKPILVSIGYSTCYWCHVLEPRGVFTGRCCPGDERAFRQHQG